MRLHVIKHVPFEGPALIAEWAEERGHQVTEAFALTEEHPPLADVDFVVVMGGPMAADDHEASPWLAAEKRWIAEAISADKLVLGVCLGAQIVAEAIGGRIRRNQYPEIGWYPVRGSRRSEDDPVWWSFPDVLVVGHWHGDTFDLPDGVAPALSSDATANQAFSANGGRVVGLQFHLEWTPEALESLVDECIDELNGTPPYVTTPTDMLQEAKRHYPACRAALWKLLDAMATVSIAVEESR